MPAYYSVRFEYDRAAITHDTVRRLYAAFAEGGAVFAGGYREDAALSLDEIAAVNQSKLENNFMLGFDEHFSHDYRQILLNYGGFTEVRGFFLNNEPREGRYVFELIVPEREMFHRGGHGGWTYKRTAVEALARLAVGVMRNTGAAMVQTGLELDDDYTAAAEFAANGQCNACPFALIRKPLATYADMTRYECHETGDIVRLEDRQAVLM